VKVLSQPGFQPGTFLPVRGESLTNSITEACDNIYM